MDTRTEKELRLTLGGIPHFEGYLFGYDENGEIQTSRLIKLWYSQIEKWTEQIQEMTAQMEAQGFVVKARLPSQYTSEPMKLTLVEKDYLASRVSSNEWHNFEVGGNMRMTEHVEPFEMSESDVLYFASVTPVPVETIIKIRSVSRPNEFYNVTVANNIPSSCSCKGFSYRHHCRHIEEVKILIKLGGC